jgi:hypothetical protein
MQRERKVIITHSELFTDKVAGTTTGWAECLDEITRALGESQ